MAHTTGSDENIVLPFHGMLVHLNSAPLHNFSSFLNNLVISIDTSEGGGRGGRCCEIEASCLRTQHSDFEKSQVSNLYHLIKSPVL